ncbi:MAG: phosphatase [Christensenellales bacterium]|jgi:putative hydrolase
MRTVLDIHTHTIASGHAYNSIYEMAYSASNKGVKLLGISDHGPAMEGSASKHYFRSSRCVPRKLYGVQILFGCELNIIDLHGTVDLDDTFSSILDYGIASMHDVCLTSGTKKENLHAYQKAMKNPKVNVIGHPDDGIFPVNFDELACAAADHGVMLELNEVSVNPRSYRQNGRQNAYQMLEACAKQYVHVLVSSDAHIECNILEHYNAIKILEEIGFEERLVVNTSIDKLINLLNIKN